MVRSGWVKPATGQVGGASIDSKTARTAFWHSPYTNADARAAQQAFGLPNLDAGKEYIGRAVLTRNEGPLGQKECRNRVHEVKAVGIRPHP